MNIYLTSLIITLGVTIASRPALGADAVSSSAKGGSGRDNTRLAQSERPNLSPPSAAEFVDVEGETMESTGPLAGKAARGAIDDPMPLPNTMGGLNDKRPLAIGDKLSFKVVEDEGLPRTLTITDSYEIDVPYIGRIPIANRTCKQLAYYVKAELEKEYYYQATVIVGLDAAGVGIRPASRGKVYVMGQVRNPGAQDIPVNEVFTVSKAILRAGGFGPYANKKKVRLMRGGGSGAASKPTIIDCVDVLEKGKWDKDIELNPDDIITVPEKIINIF